MKFYPPHILNNLTVYTRQADVIPFYNVASVVINLTNPRQAIETFGLTALEAMSCGLPVIVPTVGGITELVEDGENGYKIDVQMLDEIGTQIAKMLGDRALYLHLSASALASSRRYDERNMIFSLEKAIN